MFSVIVASTETCGIGHDNHLPWRLKGDMAFFRKLTISTNNDRKTVIMGRKTWDSLPARFKPLPNRRNVVMTKDATFKASNDGDMTIAHSLSEALDQSKNTSTFIIGGAAIYEQALVHPSCKAIYWTTVRSTNGGNIPCDTFINVPPLSDLGFILETTIQSATTENGFIYDIMKYKRKDQKSILSGA